MQPGSRHRNKPTHERLGLISAHMRTSVFWWTMARPRRSPWALTGGAHVVVLTFSGVTSRAEAWRRPETREAERPG